jgi:hypothetical protein
LRKYLPKERLTGGDCHHSERVKKVMVGPLAAKMQNVSLLENDFSRNKF